MVFYVKKYFWIVSLLFFVSCSTKNGRDFQFTYQVKLEPTNEQKLELWIPVPRTNELQKISNLSVAIDYESGDLFYIIKKEKKHGNSYLYLRSDEGLESTATIELSFNVTRYEHNKALNDKTDPGIYLDSYSMVPTGNIFTTVINENSLC